MLLPGRVLIRNLLVFGLILILYIGAAFSLKCLQCNSLQNHHCKTGTSAPTNCTDPLEKYCIKYTGRIKLGEFVFRDCSKDVVIHCHEKNVLKEMVDVCYATCDSDGCNSAPSFYSLKRTYSLPALTVLFVVFMNIL